MKFKVMKAEKCAWRARYVFVNDRKVFHLGFDPEQSRPQLFGSLLGREFRLRVPTIRWSQHLKGIKLKLWRLQHSFLHNMDGRYGWGTR
jgi:hypothetical protein